MEKLTAWATIIAVPTAVTGRFGWDVPYTGCAPHAGFVLSVIVALGLGVDVSFTRRGWL